MNEKNFHDLIEKVNNSEIASIKTIISRIFSIIDDPETSAKDLEDTIMVDPPLTNKVLKLANSAYYASRVKFSEIKEAIMWIGFTAIREIAITQKVCSVFLNDSNILGYSRSSIWENSLAGAILSKMIYRREFMKSGDDIYTAGLIRNIGIIVIDQFLPKEFEQILIEYNKKEKNLCDVEKEILGFTHSDIGEALAKKWKFPENLIVAIGCHHHIEKCAKEHQQMINTLYLSEYYCNQNNIGFSDIVCDNDKKFIKSIDDLGIYKHSLEVMSEDFDAELEKLKSQGLYTS